MSKFNIQIFWHLSFRFELTFELWNLALEKQMTNVKRILSLKFGFWLKAKEASGESVSPDSPEIIFLSAISVSRIPLIAGPIAGRVGGENEIHH